MKYVVIFLILIGFFSSANAIQYQSSETDKPVNSENSIHVIPEILWDIHEVILDGTIVEYDNNTWTYHIKINHVFKGSLNSDLISAEGFDVWNYFEKGDSALFYLSDISSVSANYKYKITDYSVKTSPVCDARSLIQISPILPNDPNRIVRGHPNIPADWEDPCVPDYFSYDPDFFNFREVITPLKQLKHKIPIDKIRCYDDNVLLFRNSNGSPACVKPESILKLIERGWANCEDQIDFRRGDICGVHSNPGIMGSPEIEQKEIVRSGSSMPDYPLDFLARVSPFIIKGTVDDIVFLPLHYDEVGMGNALTAIVINVEKDFNEKYTNNTITVVIQGGETDTTKYVSDSSPEFVIGEKIFVFVADKEPDSIFGDNYYIAGLEQGKFNLDEEGKAINKDPNKSLTLESLIGIINRIHSDE